MKIGFYSHNFTPLEKYWHKLKDKADCWWGVPEKALYDVLKDKGVRNISYHHEKYVKNLGVKKGNRFVSIEPKKIQKIIVDEIDPDIWLADTPNKLNYVSKKTFRVQTFHSIPMKKYFFYEPVLDYDLILLPGPYHKEEFVKRFNLQKDDKRFKVVGWPSTDDLVCSSYDRNKIMKEAGLDPEKKTVMYAPTWGWGYGNDALFARWFGREVEIFEKLCQVIFNQNLNFIVRLHSLSFSINNKALIDIAKKYNVLWQTTTTSNFRSNPNQYLWITDILISDLSGIISQFMVLDRPIIYIEPDENIDPWKDSDMPKSFRAGHIIKTPEEFSEAVEDSILYSDRYSKERKEFLSKIYYNLDGKATNRAVEAILDFAENQGLK